MPVINYADVATTIGRPISDPDEQAQVTQWIADVELIISARLGALGALNQPILAYIEREAVAARMRYRADRNSNADERQGSEDNFFLNILTPWWALFGDEEGSTAYSIPVSSPLDVA